MTALNKQALREAAEKATPGRIGDRIDGSGSIKYECHGYDRSLVLRADHKNMEYGFIGDNGDADELFFRLCVPDVILALLDELEAAEKRIAEPVSVPDLKPVGFLFVSDDGSVAYSPAGWPMKGFNLIGPIYGDVNACRAAMLQSDGTLTNEGTMQLSGNSEQIEPVSNRDELPLDYLQGHKDGLEWAAQLAEANHPQTGDWLYDDPIDLARAIRKGPDMPTVQGGNYPVTPDGWISCSERMPNDKQYVWCWGKSYGWTECDTFEGYYDWSRNKWWAVTDDWEEPASKVTHWMPLPEPPEQDGE